MYIVYSSLRRIKIFKAPGPTFSTRNTHKIAHNTIYYLFIYFNFYNKYALFFERVSSTHERVSCVWLLCSLCCSVEWNGFVKFHHVKFMYTAPKLN